MKTIALIAWTLIVFIAGALSHEDDIRRNIKLYGEARASGWLGNIRGTIEETP